MAAKVYFELGRHFADIEADGTQVADDVGLFLMAAPEKTQDATREARLHSPAKVQPQPPVAHMAQRTGTQVWARHLGLLFVVLVNQRLDGNIWFGNLHGFSILQCHFYAPTFQRVGAFFLPYFFFQGAPKGVLAGVGVAGITEATGAALPETDLKPLTSLLAPYFGSSLIDNLMLI